MDCPNCGLASPANSMWCDCGYDFRIGRMREPQAAEHQPTPLPRRGAPMLGISVWFAILIILGAAGWAITIYGLLVERSVRSIGSFIGEVVTLAICLPLASRSIARQGLTTRWFWLGGVAGGGFLALIPLWHHGQEWKSTGRKVFGWTCFVVVVFWLVGIGVFSFLAAFFEAASRR